MERVPGAGPWSAGVGVSGARCRERKGVVKGTKRQAGGRREDRQPNGAARAPRAARADRREHHGATAGAAQRRKRPKSRATTKRGAPRESSEGQHGQTPEGVRLQKLLSAAGVASRRASEQLILEGRVSVNGRTVRELGTRALLHDEIRVDGRRIPTDVRQRYIVLNKPKGYVTTRDDPQGRPTVIDLLGREAGYIYPVGRLDYDSEGLLLLTTDGALAERLTHPRHEVERVYEAIVAGTPDDDAIDRLRKGVFIDGRRTAPAEVTRGHTVKAGGGTTRLTITLREGRNRQVRRMCAAIGHPVRSLVRVRMGPVTLGRMRPGEWRELTAREVEALGVRRA